MFAFTTPINYIKRLFKYFKQWNSTYNKKKPQEIIKWKYHNPLESGPKGLNHCKRVLKIIIIFHGHDWGDTSINVISSILLLSPQLLVRYVADFHSLNEIMLSVLFLGFRFKSYVCPKILRLYLIFLLNTLLQCVLFFVIQRI